MAKVKRTLNDNKQDGQIEELKGGLARAMADYQNLVRRLEREREEVYLRATRNIVEDLLPTIDDLDRAQSHLRDKGLELALEQLKKILQNHGVLNIEVKQGDEFNSDVHEAVDSVDFSKDDKKPNTIAQILAKGYKWRDGKIIRPAKVTVYREVKRELG